MMGTAEKNPSQAVVDNSRRYALDGRGRLIPELETTSKFHMRRVLRDARFVRSSAKRLI